MFRLALALILAVFAMAPPSSHAAEPDLFDSLFGDEPDPLDVGKTDSAGRDDFNLISLTLDRYELTGTLSGYDTATGLCIVVAPFFEAIEVAVTVNGDTAEGWFIDPGRRLVFDFNTRTGTITNEDINLAPETVSQTPDGWCMTLEGLSALLPLDFDYDPRLLRLQITTQEAFPVEARLEREALRRRWNPPDVAAAPTAYPLLDNPYRWFDWPTADLVIDNDISAGQDPTARLTMDAVGDVLKFTGRLRANSTFENALQSLRVNFSRVNDTIDSLGGLELREIAFGDTTSKPLPLLEPSRTGRGIILSNEPSNRPVVFDVVQLRGPLPINWEAELYDGDRLIGFVTEPDANGDYVFDNVALSSGYNRLTVRLFGPFGEYEERAERVFIGPELWPQGKLFFAAGLVDPDTPLLSGQEFSAGTSAQPSQDLDPLAYLSINYGLSERVSVRLDGLLENGLENGGVTASLFSSVGGAYGALRVASAGYGRPALELSVARPLLRRLNVNGTYAHFGDLVSSVSGEGPSRLIQQGSLRLNATIPIGTRVVTALTTGTLEDRANGTINTTVQQTLAAAIQGINWNHTLEWGRSRPVDAEAQQTLNGTLLLSRPVQGVRFRSALDYALTEGFEPLAANAAAQAAFGEHGQGSLAYTYSFETGQNAVDIGYAHSFNRYAFNATLGANTDGEWQVGMSLSFSLYRDNEAARYRMGAPGLTRAGAIRTRVFEDVNVNGRFDEGERPIEDAQFIVADTIRDEETGPDGQAVLAGLPPGEPLNTSLKLSSLKDPYLRPAFSGTRVTVRPGQVTPVTFPVIMTGEADGTVILLQDGGRTPVSNVTVEVVDDNGRVVATTQSEFDGYFYVDGLLLSRPLIIRIADKDLADSGLQALPIRLGLTAEDPSALGQVLTVGAAQDLPSIPQTSTNTQYDRSDITARQPHAGGLP